MYRSLVERSLAGENVRDALSIILSLRSSRRAYNSYNIQRRKNYLQFIELRWDNRPRLEIFLKLFVCLAYYNYR